MQTQKQKRGERDMQLIDIHHHLIYGVDDGPQTFSQMTDMLLRAADNGITVLVATAHAMPGVQPFPGETYLKHLCEAQNWSNAHGLGITICMGA